MWFRYCYVMLLSAIWSTIVVCSAENEQFKTVKTTQGHVKGYMTDGVYGFYGIPFATAPTGTSKFMDPVPGPIWLGTFEAVDKSIICPQIILPQFERVMSDMSLNMTEDCLVANIILPDTEEKKLPVVVSIHGGAYSLGFGNIITPQNVVKQGNVIFVTGNYRLSANGFLCLGTDAIPGNAGVKDVLALLKWVNKNIANFGGNPDDVTLTGFSAGASIASLLMMSKAANGLYSKVILESGSGYGSWGVVMDPIESAAAFAKAEGFDSKDVRQLEEFYLNLPSEKLSSFPDRFDGSLDFAPCVEHKSRKGAVLTDAPHNVLKAGAANKVPVLISITDMEGIFKMHSLDSWSEKMNENFSEFLPADLQFESQEEKEAVARKVKEFYFGNEPIGTHMIQDFIDFTTDTLFSHSAHRTIRELVKGGNADVYFYYYTHHNPDERGANHCFQTYIIYDMAFATGGSEVTDDDKQMKKVIREIWLNFVKNGKPVPEASAEYPSGWPAAGAAGSPYMEVALTPRLRHDLLLQERLAFWDQIYEAHLRVPVPPPSPPAHTEL